MPKLKRLQSLSPLPSEVQTTFRELEENVRKVVEGGDASSRIVIVRAGVYRPTIGQILICTSDATSATSIILPTPTEAIRGEEIVVVRQAGNPTISALQSTINGVATWTIAASRAEQFIAAIDGWITYV